MFHRLDDTIVAISSPVGMSARGIIRLSGPRAVALADGVFTAAGAATLTTSAGHRRLAGGVRIAPDAPLPAEAYVFRAPRSYTRQDIVELHLPGSPPVLAILLDRLIADGARLADPGEFTARSFFAGAMDLTRVEGVAAMVHARSDAQLRASAALLHGRLARRCAAWRDRLTDLLADLEAAIDFADEPIDSPSPVGPAHVIRDTVEAIEAQLRSAADAEQLDHLPEVLLLGRPNVGKSTLFNRLTGMDRAIASATEGTTRDVIAAPLSLPAGEVLLLDCAGLSDPPTDPSPTESQDPADLARRATLRAIASADAVLFVTDASSPWDAASDPLSLAVAGKPVVIAANKADLPTAAVSSSPSADESLGPGRRVWRVSALTGEGLDSLREAIGHTLFAGLETHGAEVLALSGRQREALAGARDALTRAQAFVATRSPVIEQPELLALEIREAINALSLLLGDVTTEEVLDRVFARFCVGK